MATSTTRTNKPILPRGNDQSPKGYNRAALYSGKALDFDGVNDSVTTGSNLGNLQTLSVAMHCRIDNMTDGTARGVISQWDSSDGWMIYKSSGTSSLTFWKNGSSLINWTESTNYSDQWIHLVYVIEQGVGNYVYANGVLVGSDTTGIADIDYTNNPTFKVGAYNNTPTGYFNGAVTGVKVYSTALTAAQVSDLYNNPEKIVPTGVAESALKLWLPMMEGAGTTAYDGSGNGNHGTISGATWTHGIGSPVAQTAVIDWNKGLNYVNEYSEDFSDAGWEKTGSSISASSESNPYGKQTWEFEVTSLPSETQVRGQVSGALNTSTAFKTIVIAKAGTLDWLRVRNLFTQDGVNFGNVWFNLSTGSVGTIQSSQTATMTDLGDGWYKCEVSGTSGSTITNRLLDIGFTDSDGTLIPSATGGTGFLVLSSISLNGIYVQTLGVDQTSPVLLPQGLTSGRDITGVNLFENVRKQGALNLDGNSWAEVHDNASVDVSEFTLEGWVYVDVTENYRGALISKYKFTQSARAYAIERNGTNIMFTISNNGTTTATLSSGAIASTGWHHFVATLDNANMKVYLDGALDDTQSYTSGIFAQGYPVTLGVLDTASQATSIMKDQIAQPRIYNRALTAEEVERNYNAGKNIYK